MQNRAYSVFEIKSYDEDERIIEGIATTPTPDRMGDIVEPEGAKFALPVPLLWQHNSSAPIGNVEFAKVEKGGIRFRARLAKVTEPGTLKDRLDEAWQSIKAGIVRGVSIGFRALELNYLADNSGIHFKVWEWLELSVVTVPAQAEATIDRIKSLDQEMLKKLNPGKSEPAGASAKPSAGVSAISLKLKKDNTMNILEQIQAAEASKTAKLARMEEIMSKSAAAGETLGADESEEYDTLADEVAGLDKHMARLQVLKSANEKMATPVSKSISTPAAAAAARGDGGAGVTIPAQARMRDSAEKGIRFARFVKCLGMAKGNTMQALEIAKQRYQHDDLVVGVLKAAVAAGSTDNSTWAGFLVGDETSVFADFVEFLRPMTILGRFGVGGVPALRNIPFRVPLISQTSGGDAYWVGEGKPKPLTKFDGARTTLEPLKVATIAVLTEEVIRDSSPSAEAWVRDQLGAAVAARLDVDFIDPAKSAVSGVSPASILNLAPSVVSTGTDADAVRLDVRAVFQKFIDANNPPMSGVWVMSATNALALSLLLNPLGQREFPGISMMGGTFEGLPVIVSQYIGDVVALVNASDIYLGDEGGLAIDLSREASLQMLDNPTNDSVTPTATSMVSMFQTNSVAFRAERTINWARRRSQSVAYLSSVEWGGAVPAS